MRSLPWGIGAARPVIDQPHIGATVRASHIPSRGIPTLTPPPHQRPSRLPETAETTGRALEVAGRA